MFSYMEREKKITEDNQHQVDKAAELNGTLRRQLDEKCREVSELNNKFTKEVKFKFQFLRLMHFSLVITLLDWAGMIGFLDADACVIQELVASSSVYKYFSKILLKFS